MILGRTDVTSTAPKVMLVEFTWAVSFEVAERVTAPLTLMLPFRLEFGATPDAGPM